MGWLFEPGFFSSPQVRTALVVGAVTAFVSAIVGVFTVLRGQSFGGHALSESSATGGSAASLAGVNPLLGFVVGSLLGAGAMEAIGVRHERGRDVATGIVLGSSIGAAALFLYLTTSSTANSGLTQQLLFGSIFVVQSSTVPILVVFSVLSLGIVAVVHRPLLLSTVNADLAAARGVPVRWVGMAFMAAMALAVGLSSLSIGAILSTALLIGPAASALRLTKRIGRAVVAAVGIGIGTTWLGILLAYDSADWQSGHASLPVSFCVVGLALVVYLVSLLLSWAGGRRAATGEVEVTPATEPTVVPVSGGRR